MIGYTRISDRSIGFCDVNFVWSDRRETLVDAAIATCSSGLTNAIGATNGIHRTPSDVQSHPHCLARTAAQNQQEVVPADLDSIEANQPAAIDHPLFAEYRVRAAAGLLRRRPGRKSMTEGCLARLSLAKMVIAEEVKKMRDRRRSGAEHRPRNGIPPCIQAANFVAHEYYFHCSGRALLNRISKERIR